MGSLKVDLQIMAKVLCLCLYQFDAIVDLRALDEKCLMTFSLESEGEAYM